MSNRRFICDYKNGPCGMGIRTLLAILIIIVLLSATTWSQSPYVMGPIGSTSQPVSQTQQGLFRSPHRYDTGSGNRLIEGNVRGGAHFRGNVPYQSTTSFQASVPSADTLNSFMRYSARSEGFVSRSGAYSRIMPYYNPSQTVTFTRPGQSGVFTPRSASAIKSISGGAGTEFVRTNQPSRQVLAGTASDIRSGPMSLSMQEMDRLISAEVGGLVKPGSEFARGGVSTAGAVKQRTERRIRRATDLRVKPIGKEGIQQDLYGTLSRDERPDEFELVRQPYAEEPVPDEDMAVKRIGHERMLEQLREQMLAKAKVKSENLPATARSAVTSGKVSARTSTELSRMSSVESLRRSIDASIGGKGVTAGKGGEQQNLFDTYTRVKKQIDNLQEALERLRAGETPSVKSILESRETVGAEKVPERLDGRYSGHNVELQAFRKNIERLAAESGQTSARTPASVSAEAKRILGGKSVAAFSEDKYNEYMKAAKVYQQQGRHYRAASAYALASIYKPAEPLAYAGRSHALFGAGEYMSSALYLSRAIEISPEYAKTKVDLLAILGTDDEEQLDGRIAEIEQWYKRSDETSLKFLLGYVYYQVGELDKAKETIGTVHTKMPDSPAIDALREVIENEQVRP